MPLSLGCEQVEGAQLRERQGRGWGEGAQMWVCGRGAVGSVSLALKRGVCAGDTVCTRTQGGEKRGDGDRAWGEPLGRSSPGRPAAGCRVSPARASPEH